MLIQIEKNNQQKFRLFGSIFNLGFRPFFLLACFSAIILISLWVAVISGRVELSGYYILTNWHSHEMLFAYAFTVIAGFLLTAVTNWTGLNTIIKKPLALLTCLWLVARILPFFDINGLWIAVADSLFPILVTIGITIPIVRSKQWHNWTLIFALLLFSVANILVHLQLLGLSQTLAAGNSLAIYSILIIITIISGRVVPFFTRIVVQYEQPPVRPFLEQFLLFQLLLMAIVDIFSLPPLVMFITASLGAIAHTIRVIPWFDKKLLSVPVLWVLYAGYLWFIVGFLLHALAAFQYISEYLAIHAWTIGAIGLFTYGMMARVTLGHTGRNMIINRWIVAGFVLIFMAAMVRVFMPMLDNNYVLWIQVAGFLWVSAFVLFAYTYTFMFFKPRVDGRDG